MVNCDHRAIFSERIINMGEVAALEVAAPVYPLIAVSSSILILRSSYVQLIGHERKQIPRTAADAAGSTARFRARQTVTNAWAISALFRAGAD